MQWAIIVKDLAVTRDTKIALWIALILFLAAAVLMWSV